MLISLKALMEAAEKFREEPRIGEDVPDEMLKHTHLDTIRMYGIEDALPCGSRLFIRINDYYTLGFDNYEEMQEFADKVQSGVSAIRDSDARFGAAEVAPKPCVICGKEVSRDVGFETIIGWLHEDCDPRDKALVSITNQEEGGNVLLD